MSRQKILHGRPAWGPVVEGYAFVCPDSIVGWNGADVKTGVVTEKAMSTMATALPEKLLYCPAAAVLWAGPIRSATVRTMVWARSGIFFTTMDSKCGTAIFNTRRPCVADFPGLRPLQRDP